MFGIDQARRYHRGLKSRFSQIAQAPLRYPRVDHVRPGYRRSVYVSHAIYYRIVEGGVLIVRILGRQDPQAGLLE